MTAALEIDWGGAAAGLLAAEQVVEMARYLGRRQVPMLRGVLVSYPYARVVVVGGTQTQPFLGRAVMVTNGREGPVVRLESLVGPGGDLPAGPWPDLLILSMGAEGTHLRLTEVSPVVMGMSFVAGDMYSAHGVVLVGRAAFQLVDP